ncbi:hypothetical protein HF329_10920 [Chitinophaga oryzae]|uniref:Uncharacterized protein n=1 Tax=Chitinophaga oryzae TaxID=2725414 RepID=A0AAE6ZF38_9BACT|nr:hypothetical protein [Chitinophaga oryzae]QJB31805.1 hypothetical protein HF329_10920 [Chitinophaga oryzae]
MYLTFNTVSELICLLAGSFCLYRDKEPAWRLLILYLFLVCCVEFSGIYFRKVLHQSNVPLYNIFLLIEGLAYSLFFYHLLRPYWRVGIWTAVWLLIFFAAFTTEVAITGLKSYANYTASTLAVVVVILCLCYYYCMLHASEYFELGKYAPFWWVNGTLFFYFGSTTTNIFFSFLMTDYGASFSFSIRYIILNVLNILLYCCWSYAFLCRYLQRRYTSSSAS